MVTLAHDYPGLGVGPGGLGVYLDFAEARQRLGVNTIRERYGNHIWGQQLILARRLAERGVRFIQLYHQD